jgi:hypothetical protein
MREDLDMDAGDTNLLVQEYLQLQRTVEDFDARALTIKAWCVTFSAAGLGLAYDKHIPQLLLIASLSAVVFWLTEAVWKVHQRAFYARIATIEDHFNEGGAKPIPPFQIRRSWFASYRGAEGRKQWFSVPFHLGVMLPHVVVFVAGVLLYVIDPPGAETPEPPGDVNGASRGS